MHLSAVLMKKVFLKNCTQNKFRQTHRNFPSYNWPMSTLDVRFS